MSLADYLGPIIGLSLLGLAGLVASIAWVRFYLVPKAAALHEQAESHRVRLQAAQRMIEFDTGARELVNDLIAFENQIPAELMDKVWALDKLQSTQQGRKITKA